MQWGWCVMSRGLLRYQREARGVPRVPWVSPLGARGSLRSADLMLVIMMKETFCCWIQEMYKFIASIWWGRTQWYTCSAGRKGEKLEWICLDFLHSTHQWYTCSAGKRCEKDSTQIWRLHKPSLGVHSHLGSVHRGVYLHNLAWLV